MSIMIKGMEMPKSGTYICLIEDNNIWLVNNYNTVKFMRGEICEVPTPHGRLIDADNLLMHKTDHEMISTHFVWNAPTVIESED